MWSSTVGLINGKHRYLTAETFGYKINSNGQVLKKRQQWTIEPFHDLPLGHIDVLLSSSASISSNGQHESFDPYVLNISSEPHCSSLSSVKSSTNGSTSSDHDTCTEEHENVAIKSHLNKYLAVDSFGNVTCDSDEKTENARFTITICSMSQGRSKEEQIFWAFKNVERGYYLGTNEDGNVCCNAKMPKSRADLWLLHLIPARGSSFFALRSLGRKRYARIVESEEQAQYSLITNGNGSIEHGQVQLDATTSWGTETLFQLKFHEGGRYSILTTDGRYLSAAGKCVTYKKDIDESNQLPKEYLFTIEYHSGFLAFRDSFSQYLAATGRTSLLKSRSSGVSRDELFMFEPAPIQVSFKATFNNRWVSIKQGVDLSANQSEATATTETFQLTYNHQTKDWSIMTHDCRFWIISNGTNTVSISKVDFCEVQNQFRFKLIWSDSEATCTLKCVDSNHHERWIAARKSGQLFLASGSQAPVKFIMRFQNRKILNLRPVNGYGFVGLKSGSNSRLLEANKTSPDSIVIEYSELLSTNALSNEVLIARRTINDGQTTNSSINGSSLMTKTHIRNPSNNLELTGAEGIMCRAPDLRVAMKEVNIDSNNNCCEEENKMHNNIESSSIPSVASIINTFSNISINNNVTAISKRPQASQTLSTNRVAKLASSFDNTLQQANIGNQQQRLNDNPYEIGSANNSSSPMRLDSTGLETSEFDSQLSDKISASERLAQFECCYLKFLNNNRYLVVGDDDSSVLCDAINRACAQPWVLELRTHNSVAIRASDEHAYMQLGANGTIFLDRCEPMDASLWEF